MAKPVAKGPTAKVRDIETARSKGGRPSGPGYDPATGEEFAHPGTVRDAEEVDVFALVGTRGYSEDRFYTRSTNVHNHGEKINIRVPQGIDSQIYAAVNEIPEYTSLQSFARDAFVHRLEYLQRRYSMSDSLRRLLELERFEADNERRQREIEKMASAVTDLDEKCQLAYEEEDYGMLAEMMDTGEEIMEWLREPYRGRARAVLQRWRARAKDQIERYRASLDD